MINIVYEKARTRANLDNITFSSRAQEDRPSDAAAQVTGKHSMPTAITRPPEREGPGRVIDPTRPLSIEEIRELLEKEGDTEQ
jgi:hypothetical protein